MSAPEAGRSVERFVTEEDDWIDRLEGPFRQRFCATVAAQPLEALRRLPPPKTGGVPFGHELRVAGAYLRGGDALFDPSGFSGLYRRLAGARERLHQDAWRLNRALPEEAWREILAGELPAWIERGLLRPEPPGYRARFCLYRIGRVTLVGDAEHPPLLRRVLVGQDSWNMWEFMRGQELGRFRRGLDVGPGSGVILLNASHHCEAAFGFDINPRAVAISRLNAQINGIGHCDVRLQDVFEVDASREPFDLVTWNSPFVFLPEDCKDTHYDAYGGDFGMEIPLRFLRHLPGLLAEGGVAYVAAASPILMDGRNLFDEELVRLAPEAGLTVVEHVNQSYWHPFYREFHAERGIRRFEHFFLELRRGAGGFERREASLPQRLSDAARQLYFRVR